MTTTPIPEAAVAAAHAAGDACSFSHRPDGPWACCTEAALAAALPLLGDTEWAVHCDTADRYIAAPDEAAARDMLGWHGCDGTHRIMARTVTSWTEAPGE